MKKEIRIVVLFGSPFLYGSEKANIDVFDALKNKYDYVDILFLTDILDGQSIVHPYLERLKFKYMPVHYHYRFMKNMRISEWIKKISKIVLGSIALIKVYIEFRPTHIYVSKPEYFLNFIPVLFFTKKPIIYRIGDSPVVHNLPYEKLWNYIVKKASKIVCVSKFIEQQVQLSGGKKSQTEVIYSRPHDRKKSLNVSKNRQNCTFEILYVGQIAKHKGLDLFVEAAVKLCRKYENISFTIAGKIDINNQFAKEQIDIVNEKYFSENIIFLDYVSDVDSLYESSNLHICPSVYDEPLANVLIDAKKHSIPSIIFDVGGLPEIIEHKISGYICKEKTALALETAIEYYFLHQDLCEEVGHNAFKSLEDLKIEQFSERWLNVFETTI